MSSRIVDDAKVIAAIEKLTLSRNFTKKIFNSRVDSAYPDDDSEENNIARKVLLITDRDTLVEITHKQITFWFTLFKFTPIIEDRFIYAKATKGRGRYITTGLFRLKPETSYINGRLVGGRYGNIPHVDEALLYELRGFSLVHGNVKGVYFFDDASQIKVLCKDELECHRVINHLLKVVDKSKRQGTSETHTYFGKPPKDASRGLLYGIRSNITKIEISNNGRYDYTVIL